MLCELSLRVCVAQELMSSNVIVKRIPGTSQIVRSTPSQIVASRQFSHFSNTFQILPSVSGNQPSRIRTGMRRRPDVLLKGIFGEVAPGDSD